MVEFFTLISELFFELVFKMGAADFSSVRPGYVAKLGAKNSKELRKLAEKNHIFVQHSFS